MAIDFKAQADAASQRENASALNTVSEETWALLETSTGDEASEVEAQQDIAFMRAEPGTHLTSAIIQHVIEQPQGEAATSIVLPHLCRCAWCRNTLYQTLQLCGMEDQHPAYTLLQEAETWARWAAAGHQATKAAQRSLREQGASIVYERDGVLYEELPDGTVQGFSDSTQ